MAGRDPGREKPSGDTHSRLGMRRAREGGNMAQTNARDEFNYLLLGRLKNDCEHYLNAGTRNRKRLWALDEAEQVQKMKELYAALPEKPEWLTLADIERYEAAMLRPQVEVKQPKGPSLGA